MDVGKINFQVQVNHIFTLNLLLLKIRDNTISANNKYRLLFTLISFLLWDNTFNLNELYKISPYK